MRYGALRFFPFLLLAYPSNARTESWDHVTLTKEIFNFPQKFKLKNNEIEDIFKGLDVVIIKHIVS